MKYKLIYNQLYEGHTHIMVFVHAKIKPQVHVASCALSIQSYFKSVSSLATPEDTEIYPDATKEANKAVQCLLSQPPQSKSHKYPTFTKKVSC